MISFSLDEDQELVRETVHKFASEAIRPHARAWERARAVPASTRRAFHELSNVLMTPHVSGWTDGMLRARAKLIENIHRAARGEPPVNLIPSSE